MTIARFLSRLRADSRGYTLVVVAAIFAAFAVVGTVYIDRNLAAQVLDRQKNDHDRMTRLANALVQYAARNGGRYPCPASPLVVPSNGTFGDATANCHNTVIPGIDPLESTGDIIRGMVPVRALAPYGIDVSDAFDSWNGRIMYVVNRQTTPLGSGSIAVRPIVTQQPLNISMNRPSFLLVSYGRDRLGAYMRGQSASSLLTGPSASCANNSIYRREENCDKDSAFVLAPSMGSNDESIGNYFDDIVTVYSEGARKCKAATVSWYSCSAGLSEQEQGFSQAVASTNGFTGSATITCEDGQFTTGNETCANNSSGNCSNNYDRTNFNSNVAGPNTGCFSMDIDECGNNMTPNWIFRHNGNCTCTTGTSHNAC